MIGSLFCRDEESPGETILYQGRTFKSYRGWFDRRMESARPLRAGSDIEEAASPCAEGVEDAYPIKAAWALRSTCCGLRSGMVTSGRNVEEFQEKAIR